MDEIALEAKAKMAKTIEAFKADLAVLRTGRASPAMLDRVECDYYGVNIHPNVFARYGDAYQPRRKVNRKVL